VCVCVSVCVCLCLCVVRLCWCVVRLCWCAAVDIYGLALPSRACLQSPFARSCDSGCWSPVHIGMCAVSVVAVTLMLPLATIGFVSQQRHDAEDVAAIEISHAEAKRRTKHLRARLRQQARLNKRKRRQQRRDRAATTNPWAIGSSSSDDDDGMGSSSSDDDVAVPFEPQSSPEMAAAFSASGRVITRSRDVRVPAQRSSDGLPLSSMATPMVYLDCSAVLQLQQCSRYTISLALTKVCSAVACVFISPVHAQAATVAVAALNTGLLAMVWSRGAFANPNHDVLARVAHVMAATLSWLLVVNSSFVFSTPDLRLWGAEAPSADVLRLDNDDGAVAGHLVVVGTAATYVVTAAACAVMYFKTVGGLSLFAPSSVSTCRCTWCVGCGGVGAWGVGAWGRGRVGAWGCGGVGAWGVCACGMWRDQTAVS